MSNYLKRFFLFAVGGMAALTLWAVVFGALLGVLSIVFAPGTLDSDKYVRPDYRDSLMMCIGLTAFFTLPLSFLLFGIAGLSAPGQKGRDGLRALITLCLFRSVVGALSVGLMGSLLAVILRNVTAWFDAVVPPPLAVGLIAGLFIGFSAGLIWGVVEGVRTAKGRPPAPNSSQPVPPIATP